MSEGATRHDVSVDERVGYVALMRGNRNFRWLWTGTLISQLGDWFNFIALVTLLGNETGSPLAVGGAFLAKMLPWAVALPAAGVIADRYDRRRLMIGADLARAVVVAGLFFVTDDTIWLAYVLTTLQMVAGAVHAPARDASLPNITTPRELLTANALMGASWSTMLAVGAALGGFATEALGPRPVFLIDSLTYLWSGTFIYRTVIPQETATTGPSLLRIARRQIVEGWRHLRRNPRVGRISLAKATWSIAGGSFVFMLTLLGEEITAGLQAAGIGVLFMARGIGTGIGPVAARAWFTREHRWPALMGLFIAGSGLCYGIVGLLPWTISVALLVIVAHAFSGANWMLATVLLQKRTPDRFRGRVFSTDWLLSLMAEVVSIFTASLLLETEVLSLRGAFQAFALAQIACGALWLLTVVPRERRDASLSGDEQKPRV